MPNENDASRLVRIQPPADITPFVPAHGVASIIPAQSWEYAFISGNGTLGAMVYGCPDRETLIFNRAGLYLPQGSQNEVPNVAPYLAEIRKIIGDALEKDGTFERGYREADQLLGQKAAAQGHHYVYTDPFHPGMILRLDQKISDEEVSNYSRTENFETGEIAVRWNDGGTDFRRDVFVSRPDGLIVMRWSAQSQGKISFEIGAEPIESDKIQQTTHLENGLTNGWITTHNLYKLADKTRPPAGFDIAVRVVPQGGAMSIKGDKICVEGADSVVLLARIDLFEKAGDNRIERLQAILGQFAPDYDALLSSHAKIHGELFRRVSLDLGAATARKVAAETLLDEAARTQKLSPALAELLYEGGRYVILSSTGENPPNLQGIWTGTWTPAWSGDFTLDTNLQLAIAHALSSNTPELLLPFFETIEGFVPDFRQNAKNLYGARGIRAPLRASNNGLELHWPGFPSEFWNCGAGWLAHWFFDYFQYTGDREFLRDRAVPFLKETALFYEDFLVLDDDGHTRFRPTFSAENGSADNATQDIMVAREVLTNLIRACKTLGIETENLAQWQNRLDTLPPFVYTTDGAVKEWAVPDSQRPEDHNHRHAAQLYDAFQSTGIVSEESDPKLWNGMIAALKNRLNSSGDDSSHGYMHLGLAAATLEQSDLAWSRVQIMATGRSIYPSMATAHYGGPRVFNVDSNGAIPEILSSLLVQSQMGRLMLLPALPAEAMQRGELRGLAARGGLLIESLRWDTTLGHCEAILTSNEAQTLDLMLGRTLQVTSISAAGKTLDVASMGIDKWGAKLWLPAHQAVKVIVRFQ